MKTLLTTRVPSSLVYAALVDIVLAFLPWPILLRFHMYRGEKVGVAIAMSMGVLYVKSPNPRDHEKFAGALLIDVETHSAGIAGFVKVSTINRMESKDFNCQFCCSHTQALVSWCASLLTL